MSEGLGWMTSEDLALTHPACCRLYIACEAYHTSISKKIVSDALNEPEKLLPIDALGAVMMVHGEQFPEDSGFDALGLLRPLFDD